MQPSSFDVDSAENTPNMLTKQCIEEFASGHGLMIKNITPANTNAMVAQLHDNGVIFAQAVTHKNCILEHKINNKAMQHYEAMLSEGVFLFTRLSANLPTSFSTRDWLISF
ncbi:hypothetical protein [Salinimonas sediminis]|uniref:Uncharacterized protein n=1 Tax=Salinimonas sediminis TaxID=2303538 RepID=A0A346NLE4_9ALTE|nr:hypothetical protein [Salinimonas sediminis]AXR06351.1 hypothetical protein D0Y50_08215 [Salinimonas sediminis]